MRFTDSCGGVSRRLVILHFPEIISPGERDLQLKEKISGELAVIVCQLMQQFSQPQDSRALLQSQQNSDEAMRIKRDADPMVDFCRYLFTTPEPNALYMGIASIRPLQPKRYLYHAYLAYMEANGYKNPLSMKMFGLPLESIMREYGHHYMKLRTKSGMQTNLDLTDESSSDWLPKCDDPTAI
ncbi:DNA primase [Pantoea sp. SGAir0184]